MNIILKSFLIALAVIVVITLMPLCTLLQGFYGLISVSIIVFILLWVYFYVLLK